MDRPRPAGVPFEIDTGMGRSGVRWDEMARIRDVAGTPSLEGCYTQFHSAERSDGSPERQAERFLQAVGQLPRRPALLHVANSASRDAGPQYAFDLIRPGVFLYARLGGSRTCFAQAGGEAFCVSNTSLCWIVEVRCFASDTP